MEEGVECVILREDIVMGICEETGVAVEESFGVGVGVVFTMDVCSERVVDEESSLRKYKLPSHFLYRF